MPFLSVHASYRTGHLKPDNNMLGRLVLLTPRGTCQLRGSNQPPSIFGISAFACVPPTMSKPKSRGTQSQQTGAYKPDTIRVRVLASPIISVEISCLVSGCR
jgi:hypothetical protein